VDLVAAVGAGDVLRARHDLGELRLRFLLRPVGDVTEVRGNVGRQQAGGDESGNLRSPGPVRGQDDQRHWLERRGSEKLVEAAVRIAPLQVGIELQALP
jgi:hypothetical protein